MSMPHRLKQRQEKIQAKRKQTPWREFVMEIWSWFPLVLHRSWSHLSRFAPEADRIGEIIDFDTYADWITQKELEIWSSSSFFQQIQILFKSTTLAGTKTIWQNENSVYNDIILGAKNAYLNFVVLETNKAAYNYGVNKCDEVYNSLQILLSQNVYMSRAVTSSSNIFYCSNIQDSSDVRFCANMRWCTHCLFSSNLENKSYCIQNKQYNKSEYEDKKLSLLWKDKSQFLTILESVLSINWSNTWDSIVWQFNRNCSDIESWFFNFQVHEWRNVLFGAGTWDATQVYDVFSFWWTTTDHNYACMWVWRNASHVYCSVEASPSVNNCYYCYLVDTCSYCLGCIWLKNKSYCIFNKQYTKEARYDKVDEIFVAMEAEWTLWDFFPGSMNPFYFNDTAAYLIDDSFTKEEVDAEWYLRRDEKISVDIPEGMVVVKTSELADYESRVDEVRTIDPNILKKVIQDEEWNVYRIVKMEYDFLVKHWLPLPRLHWLDRLKMNFSIS